MSFWDALSVLRRRWKFSVPALFLAVGVAAAAFTVAPPSYQSHADVLFLPSTKSADSPTPINPYMALGPTLGSTADVITRVVTGPQVVQRLATQGGTATYEVQPDLSTSAPVLIVSSHDRSATAAARTTSVVVAEIKRTLREQQEAAAAPPGTWVSASVLVSEAPQRMWKSQVRLGLAALAAMTLLCLALIFGAEARRRKPLSALPVESDASQPVAVPADIRQGRDATGHAQDFRARI